MNMGRLQEGVKLKGVWWSGEDGASLEVGKYGCLSLTVSMENGQMSPVPWVEAKKENGSVSLHNLSLVEGVEFLL